MPSCLNSRRPELFAMSVEVLGHGRQERGEGCECLVSLLDSLSPCGR
jgi:hypothetical protein